MKKRGLVTSESVGPGHPDKICDQISDAILDAYLSKDKDSRVAVNVSIKNDKMFLFGEVTSKAEVNYTEVVNEVLNSIGIDTTYNITREISQQSPDIAQGVDTGGAGDQGMMIGYATKETEDFMPLPMSIANGIMMSVNDARVKNLLPWSKADMKCQVTINYELVNDAWSAGRCPVDTIVLSVQHSEDYDKNFFEEGLKNIVREYLNSLNYSFYPKYKLYINNTGKFVIGGSYGDSGLTGRKIIVDTYGGIVPHGGGAFSGKDYTKVDRSGAYAARWITKNIVASGLADRCEIQVAYAIGEEKPVSILVDTHGTGNDKYIEKMVSELFELSPKWIQSKLNLKRPIYGQLAVFGHFGRDNLNLPWERLDLVEEIKKYKEKN
jgi:S-adenosylmethionine synthetase